MRDFKLSV